MSRVDFIDSMPIGEEKIRRDQRKLSIDELVDVNPNTVSQPEIDGFEINALRHAQNDTVIKETLKSAYQKNPDLMAEVYNQPESSIIPTDIVQDRLEFLKARNKLSEIDFQKLQAENPVVYQYLSEKRNADIAHDEIGFLTHTENVFRSFASGAHRGIASSASGLGQIVQSGANLAARGFDEILPEGADEYLYKQPGDLDIVGFYIDNAEQQKLAAQSYNTPAEQRNYVTDVSGGLGQLGGQIATLLLNPSAGTAMLLGQGADQQAERQRETGSLNESNVSDLAILSSAPVTAALEKIGIGQILNRVPPNIKNRALQKVADVAKAGGVEAVEEVLEGISLGVIEKVTTNENADIYGGAIEEGQIAFGTGAAAKIIHGLLTGRKGKAPQILEEKTNLKEKEFTSEQEQIDEIISLSQSSKLPQRSKDATKAFIESLEEKYDNNAKIYIDAKAIAELYQEGNYDPENEANKKILAQMEGALANNSDIEIPLSDFISEIAPNSDMESLRPHLRLNPESLSQAETEVAQETREQTVQQLIEAAQQNTQTLAEAETLWQEITEQLIATGRMNEQNARASASIYPAYAAVKAQELDIPISEVYDRMGLRIEKQTAPEPANQAGFFLAQDFGDLKITEQVEVEETGEKMQVTQSAQSAWDRAHKRRDMVEKLRGCLSA